ncbi:transcriptional repressor LexA [bacterium]|nr:transcriptional repressor LexA [bacterium]
MLKRRAVTARQREILNYIVGKQQGDGYPPSMQEIADHFGFKSLTTVADHLHALERKELISRSAGARTITLQSSEKTKVSKHPYPNETCIVPVIGTVAAGTPMMAVENIEDYYVLDKRLIKYGDTYMLRVKGDSMIDAHIAEGDHVLVKPQSTADPHDIVVALIDNETTVKRFIPRDEYVILKPENKLLKPFIVPRDKCRIAGKVIGVIRNL